MRLAGGALGSDVACVWRGAAYNPCRVFHCPQQPQLHLRKVPTAAQASRAAPASHPAPPRARCQTAWPCSRPKCVVSAANTHATQHTAKGTCHDGLCCCHTNARGGWGGSAATTHIQKQRSQALHVQPQCWWLTWLWGAAIQGCKGHRDGVQVRYACSGEGDDVVA